MDAFHNRIIFHKKYSLYSILMTHSYFAQAHVQEVTFCTNITRINVL